MPVPSLASADACHQLEHRPPPALLRSFEQCIRQRRNLFCVPNLGFATDAYDRGQHLGNFVNCPAPTRLTEIASSTSADTGRERVHADIPTSRVDEATGDLPGQRSREIHNKRRNVIRIQALGGSNATKGPRRGVITWKQLSRSAGQYAVRSNSARAEVSR